MPAKQNSLLADKFDNPMITTKQTLVANVVTTASTTTTPAGYTTTAQADAIVTAINAINAVLVAHGLM